MKVEYYLELSNHLHFRRHTFLCLQLPKFFFYALSPTDVFHQYHSPFVSFRTSNVGCENLSGVINDFWHDSLDTLTLFCISLVVNTLFLWIISYWCVFVFWHCLGVFNARRKWKLRTKGRLKLQFHAGSIAIFSLMHKIPNKAKSLQPCACNAPLAYVCICSSYDERIQRKQSAQYRKRIAITVKVTLTSARCETQCLNVRK